MCKCSSGVKKPHNSLKKVSQQQMRPTPGVSWQVSYRWKDAWQQGGVAALASKGRAGRKAKLGSRATQTLLEALLEGPAAHGYKTQLWTLPRVAALIEELTGVRYHPGHVWRVLGSLGFSCQRPERRAIERDEPAIRQWKRVGWPGIKKSGAARPINRICGRKRTEYRSTRVRTWAPRGQTPILQETFNWKSLSIVGGLTLLRLSPRSTPEASKGRKSSSSCATSSATSLANYSFFGTGHPFTVALWFATTSPPLKAGS